MKHLNLLLFTILIVAVGVGVSCNSTSSGSTTPEQNDNQSNDNDNSNDNSDSGSNDNTDVTVTVESDLELGEDGHPLGWTEKSHSNSTDPDYDIVFEQDTVLRMDITISAENWQAMLTDMTDIYGEFGTQSQGGSEGGPGDGTEPPDNGEMPDDFDPGMNSNGPMPNPDEMMPICEDQSEGDACTIDMNGFSTEGTCTLLEETLYCMPDGGFAGPGEGDGEMPTEQPEIPDDAQDMGGGAGMMTDRNPIWAPCTLEFEGNTWWNVGIRFKGQSTLSNTWAAGIYKLPLRLDFDEFEDESPEIDNQRFYGFKKLSLASNCMDSSYLREKVTHDIFRDAGLPAPMTTFYRVYIDHGDGPIYFGLYTMTEIPDDPLLDRCFGNSDGNLYKPTSTWATFDEEAFDKENNKSDDDYSDVQAVIEAIHADQTDLVTWRSNLEAVFDVQGFLRWLATNTLVQNWDTYGVMAQNYYIYGDMNYDGRLSWIPWDNNMAMMESGSGGMMMAAQAGSPMDGNQNGGMQTLSFGMDEVSENWPLIYYLIQDPVYWEDYLDYLVEVADTAFVVAPTQARLQAAYNLIQPYVTGSDGELEDYTFIDSAEEFESALDGLLSHVEERQDALDDFLLEQE